MTSTVRQSVIEEVAVVLREAGKVMPTPDDSVVLLTGGLNLDSLDVAVLVVRLEQRLQRDPFADAALDRFPTNLGELIALYERPGAA